MKKQHLNIVSFNIPYPADYGGVIDVFYRLKTLSEQGIGIHLHCFEYGREHTRILNDLCESVTYYPRSLSVWHQFSRLPFIVKTRNSKQLLANLLKNNYPILFEGLHSCYFLNHSELALRNKFVRSHNIEHKYYKGLAENASSLAKKVYFSIDALKLKHFERVLSHATAILAISEADKKYLEQYFNNVILVLPSHPSDEVNILEGFGDYILYHADLSTQENIEAATYIMNEIAPNVEANFVFAGKNPSEEIQKLVALNDNCEIFANPDHAEMQQYIANAHINLLPTFQATGFKLKLLNALFNGRFCVGTPEMVAGTGLDSVCEIANSPEEMIHLIRQKLNEPFSFEEIEKRKALMKMYSNSAILSDFIKML